MKVLQPSYQIETKINEKEILEKLEKVARTCYKSEDYIKEGSAAKLVGNLVKMGHEAMIEHFSVTVRFVVDRGVAMEMIRHRLCSFANESTRYCNYSKGKFDNSITVIEPPAGTLDKCVGAYEVWANALLAAEEAYLKLLNWGISLEIARGVLPTALKSELVVTANLREWRHFFKLRCSPAAHPQIREVAIPLLEDFKQLMPVLFGDLDF